MARGNTPGARNCNSGYHPGKPPFRASKFITEEELPPLLAAAKARGTLIIPVVVGLCDYNDSELAPFQAANDPSKPLYSLSKHKRAVVWQDVVERIKQTLPDHVQTAQEAADSQPIISGSQWPGTNGDETTGRVSDVAWAGMGGEQILTYARELDEQGRYGELLDMAIDMNLRGLYDLACAVALHAVNGPASPYDAWFERAFALAQLNRQEDAIAAFKRAYGLIDARLRHGMPTLKLPSGSRGVAFAGAGSGVHYHGMGLVPDAIIALKVAAKGILTIGNFKERGMIRHSTFHKTATYMGEMGGNTRWVALAVVLGDGPTESEILEPVAGIDRMDVDDIIRWGTLLNSNMEYVESLALLDRAIQREPLNFDAWFEKTYALTALNRKEAYGAFARAFNESNPDYRRLGYSDTVFEPGVRRSMFAGVGLAAWAHNLSTVPTAVYCVSERGATALYHPRAGDANIADAEVVRGPGFGNERWVGLAISDSFDSEDE